MPVTTTGYGHVRLTVPSTADLHDEAGVAHGSPELVAGA